mmetsp:Transcript_69317/g.122384  ORF Transcript_69317/g.122384 Transcript_69317/m.122384 type:complete len:140 (-) Transcript_69317:3030-3449(-)
MVPSSTPNHRAQTTHSTHTRTHQSPNHRPTPTHKHTHNWPVKPLFCLPHVVLQIAGGVNIPVLLSQASASDIQPRTGLAGRGMLNWRKAVGIHDTSPNTTFAWNLDRWPAVESGPGAAHALFGGHPMTARRDQPHPWTL